MAIFTTNTVEKPILRKIQKETLGVLHEALLTSAGPLGSNTQIARVMSGETSQPGRNPVHIINDYTKDGHNILMSIHTDDVIADSVKTNVESITKDVVKKVGDGTTQAVLMSNHIFNTFCKLEEDALSGKGDARYRIPKLLEADFRNAVAAIKEEVSKAKCKEFDEETARKIALVSSNGNEEIANMISELYKTYGEEVYITVEPSTTKDTWKREFNGMALITGSNDPVFMNNFKDGSTEIENPNIYHFRDPIDTPDMITLLVEIVKTNIIKPMNAGRPGIPTVVCCPMLSRDVENLLGSLFNSMKRFNKTEADMEQKKKAFPLLIIKGIVQADIMSDIAELCGAPAIFKSINPDVKEDLIKKQEENKNDESGMLVPTVRNVASKFAGHCQSVRSDVAGTLFREPSHMYKRDEHGEVVMENGKAVHSDEYVGLLNNLESTLKAQEKETLNLNILGMTRKRINSLNSSAATIFVGGITPADRDALKDLVDDAVLNCRSAAHDGVGLACGLEGYKASYKLWEETGKPVYKAIKDAYESFLKDLYGTNPSIPEDSYEEIFQGIREDKGVYDIQLCKFSNDLLSSISTDTCILECISRVITLMITNTQCILPTAEYNKYTNISLELPNK